MRLSLVLLSALSISSVFASGTTDFDESFRDQVDVVDAPFLDAPSSNADKRALEYSHFFTSSLEKRGDTYTLYTLLPQLYYLDLELSLRPITRPLIKFLQTLDPNTLIDANWLDILGLRKLLTGSTVKPTRRSVDLEGLEKRQNTKSDTLTIFALIKEILYLDIDANTKNVLSGLLPALLLFNPNQQINQSIWDNIISQILKNPLKIFLPINGRSVDQDEGDVSVEELAKRWVPGDLETLDIDLILFKLLEFHNDYELGPIVELVRELLFFVRRIINPASQASQLNLVDKLLKLGGLPSLKALSVAPKSPVPGLGKRQRSCGAINVDVILGEIIRLDFDPQIKRNPITILVKNLLASFGAEGIIAPVGPLLTSTLQIVQALLKVLNLDQILRVRYSNC